MLRDIFQPFIQNNLENHQLVFSRREAGIQSICFTENKSATVLAHFDHWFIVWHAKLSWFLHVTAPPYITVNEFSLSVGLLVGRMSAFHKLSVQSINRSRASLLWTTKAETVREVRHTVLFSVVLWVKQQRRRVFSCVVVLSDPLLSLPLSVHSRFLSSCSLLSRLPRCDFKQMFLCRHGDSFSAPLVSHEQIKAKLQTPLVFPPFLFCCDASSRSVSLYSFHTLSSSHIHCVFSFSSLLAKPWDCTVSIHTFNATVWLCFGKKLSLFF